MLPDQEEKHDVALEHVEDVEPYQALSDGTNLLDGDLLVPEVRVAAERRLVRKLDIRLLPTIILIYIMNYIDVSTSSHLLTSTNDVGS